ncbi:MAG: ToMV susceptible protein tm-1(GCR26) [Cirrosporium novae-zelandiae]|nr:MAG: ToMV susceptible protein tm-1(GCR26) [Cirrosporium novae-zelandiae]
MPRIPRTQILSDLHTLIENGTLILGAGAGSGLTAKSAAQGGADLLIVYNSGRFRMAGAGSLAGLLPYGDANAIMMDMAREILPTIARLDEPVPVLAGVCGTDPFREMEGFLRQVLATGFSGVQNFPTVGLIDGKFRAALEETGMGFSEEVKMIETAANMGFLTAPYVFNVDQAEMMAKAGADIIVAHMGLTMGGNIGAKTGMGLDDCVRIIQDVRDAAVTIKRDVIVLCHGGPIAEVESAQYILEKTKGVHGFFGASSMERLPVETAVMENAQRFKSIDMS